MKIEMKIIHKCMYKLYMHMVKTQLLISQLNLIQINQKQVFIVMPIRLQVQNTFCAANMVSL